MQKYVTLETKKWRPLFHANNPPKWYNWRVLIIISIADDRLWVYNPGQMDQWTDGPMYQWTSRLID